jgi:hypothetical protein
MLDLLLIEYEDYEYGPNKHSFNPMLDASHQTHWAIKMY